MSSAATLRWLTGLRNLGSRLGVERMATLAERLPTSKRARPCFHIAGTNGKGSTSAMIEAIQRAHGRKTGLYTSPHLISLGERIQINRRPLSETRVVQLVEVLRPHYEAIFQHDAGLAPTFFELMTAAAFLEFETEGVEVMILETGLGGRLDATNICQPDVTIITSIGFDHQEFLGDTLAKIAFEKAGIMKSGVPCVVGVLPAEARVVVEERARVVGAPLYWIEDYFKKEFPRTNLIGTHQRQNAAMAWLACKLAVKVPVDEATMSEALLQVEWAARWQSLPLTDGRTLIIDGTHNEEGVRAITPLLKELAKPTVIIGAVGQGRAAALIQGVAPWAGSLILVQPDHEKACSIAELKALIPVTFQGAVRVATVAEIFNAPQACQVEGHTIVALGSLYLAGEVLARYHGKSWQGGSWQDRLPAKP